MTYPIDKAITLKFVKSKTVSKIKSEYQDKGRMSNQLYKIKFMQDYSRGHSFLSKKVADINACPMPHSRLAKVKNLNTYFTKH